MRFVTGMLDALQRQNSVAWLQMRRVDCVQQDIEQALTKPELP